MHLSRPSGYYMAGPGDIRAQLGCSRYTPDLRTLERDRRNSPVLCGGSDVPMLVARC